MRISNMWLVRSGQRHMAAAAAQARPCGWHVPGALRQRCTGSHSTSPAAANQSQLLSSVRLRVPTEAAMEQLAWLLADADPALAAGDVVCLRGGVGAGKSYFSRAFIRAAVGDEQMPVPSPTFLLQQSYEVLAEKPLTIHHFDLYRLENVPEAALQRLDLPGCFSAALCLVEWPERLPAHQLPSTRLDMHIEALAAQPCEQAPGGYSGAEEEEEEDDEFSDRRPRACTLAAHGERWQRRLSRLHQVLLSASMDELMGVQVQGSC